MYMNKTKRNLIMASAIINLVTAVASLVSSIVAIVSAEFLQKYEEFYYLFGYTTNIIFVVISFALGLSGSILLLYAIRNKGKYFRRSYGVYVAGFVIVVICGGWIAWLLLFISAFVPDIVIINDKTELRREARLEEKEEILRDKVYEEKKAKIEELKKLRDTGIITEEEYKEKLFELL